MKRLLVTLVLVVVSASSGLAQAQSQDERPASIRVRTDVVVRWAPRWVLQARETEVGAVQRFWHRVDELPMTLRLSLDADRLMKGRIGVHLATWGTLDLTVDTEGGIAAGDVALGYVDARLGKAKVWLGRRFITWGPPGGLHLDGAGADVDISHGFSVEAFAGRPVVSRMLTSTGASGNLTQPTGAYGGRVSWVRAGFASASAAYVQRWSHGLETDRVVDVDFSARPSNWADLNGGATWDVRTSRPTQAQIGVDLVAHRAFRLLVLGSYVDPRALLPDWSVLKAFSSMLYTEAALGGTLRVSNGVHLRVEGAYRRSWQPDRQDGETLNGYRIDAYVRGVPWGGRPGYRVMVSRRDDGAMGYTLVQAAVAFETTRDLQLAVELSAAFDDALEREAYVGRLSGEYRVASAWTVGAALDVSRTPTADAEVRGLLRAVYRRGVSQ
ncbi:MAG: hypothetical protein GXP55_17600 [Deltaproteobacteria bacterium]|nr:hypothetical protein [Deltaproteobacteria bacterium]